MFAPGSKPLLFALLQVLRGDVVLPAPCWVSYAAHAALVGKRVIRVPIGSEAGGVPDPAALRAALAAGRPARRAAWRARAHPARQPDRNGRLRSAVVRSARSPTPPAS